jgi:hypothetical protein
MAYLSRSGECCNKLGRKGDVPYIIPPSMLRYQMPDVDVHSAAMNSSRHNAVTVVLVQYAMGMHGRQLVHHTFFFRLGSQG